MTDGSSSIVNLLVRLWGHIGIWRRFQFLALFLLMICVSFAEVLSIGAVLPFLGLLTAPERVFAQPLAQHIIQPLGLQTPSELLLPITILFASAAFISGVMRLLLLFVQTRLGHAIGADFSLGMYRRTLYQPYSVHVARNSSEVIAGISNKAKAIVGSTLIPVMTIVSSTLLLIAVLFALLIVEPVIAATVFVGVGVIYASLIIATKGRLLSASREISEGHTKSIKVLQEGLGGIRDILIDGTQEVHCNVYQAVDNPLRRAMANVQIISVSPRYGVEALGMVLISALAYALAIKGQGISDAIPVLGTLAMGAQRMLPMLQQSYSSWSSIRGGQVSLSDALELLDQPLPTYLQYPIEMQFDREITLKDVSFKYGPGAPEILNGLNISIAKGTCVGIIGNTGCGKSTFLDVIMGLLPPERGQMFVDDNGISDESRRGWQKHIAHVPQTIFLADAKISENIALGVPRAEIDHLRVRSAATSAQIDDFIESLEDKYETRVGERGVRLSGGQRQRIGIARALYKHADLLVLDEATSALDNETESKVMQSIEAMSDKLTIIIVAHRLSTLKNCDEIIELDGGKVKRVGTYAEIVGG